MNLKLKQKLNRIPFRKISISKKEKNLLLLLIISILLFVFFKYIARPQQEKIHALEKKGIEYLDRLAKTDIILAKEDSIKREWLDLNQEYYDMSKKFYSKIDQPEIMYQLNKIINDSDLEIPSISFSGTEILNIDNLDNEIMKISLPFKGSYKALNEFLLKLKKNQKKFLVSQLSLSKDREDMLNGQITLEVFTGKDFSGSYDAYYYNNIYEPINKDNPFKPYEGFIEVEEPEMEADGDETRIIVDDLETNDIYFMATSTFITGKISRFDKAKHGMTSKRLEYFISTNFKKERAYLVLDDRNIILKYPPDSIGVWTYAYGYSPITIGLRFQDMDGNKIDVEMAKGVNWIGWEYISATPPKDISIYPLKLGRIYLELGENRDDFGVLLFDRIEAKYSNDEVKMENIPSYIFYVVKPGDTFSSISENFYGSQSQYKNILKDNGLNENSDITTGMVLVIRNR